MLCAVSKCKFFMALARAYRRISRRAISLCRVCKETARFRLCGFGASAPLLLRWSDR